MHHYLSVTGWDRSVSGHAKAKFKFGSPFGEGISVVSGVQPSREIKNIKNNVQSAYIIPNLLMSMISHGLLMFEDVAILSFSLLKAFSTNAFNISEPPDLDKRVSIKGIGCNNDLENFI